MKHGIAISIIVASIIAVTPMSSFAGQGKQGGAGAGRMQQVDRDLAYDRDRMQDRAQTEALEQDRLRMQDTSRIMDQNIYGQALMTDAERNHYRKELGASGTPESRMEFQAQHEQRMQDRALMQGQDLVPPGQRPVYGGEFMSVQERNEYREQLRSYDSEKEREQHQAQHREQMDERARALGREIEEAE